MTERQQRRLAAILAADIAGYSALMAADEARTVRDLKAHQAVVLPIFAKFGGRIIDTAGDGILAEFTSVVDSLDCAAAIQEIMAKRNAEIEADRRMQYRIGINLGDVMYDDTRIYGDGINVAARLEGIADPGGICISSKVYEDVRGKVQLGYEDIGEHRLKNIPHPIHIYRVQTCADPVIPTAARSEVAITEYRASLAVLPFRTLQKDELDAYFAEGIIDDIIRALDGLKELLVVARSSTQPFARAPLDLRRVGNELNVRYALHGSVYRSGDTLRIAAELCETQTGQVLWADRFDGKTLELFDLQDRIALRVSTSIAPHLRQRELIRVRRKHPESMTAYDLTLQALHLIHQLDRASIARARTLLERAVAHDPDYALAYTHMASLRMKCIGQGWSEDETADRSMAARAAELAIARDANDALALAIYGHLKSYLLKQYDTGRDYLERALAVGPSCAWAWSYSSLTCGYLGDYTSAITRADQAVRRSPIGPDAFWFEHFLSQAYYLAGHFEYAVRWGRKSAIESGNNASNLRCLIASLVAIGEIQEARALAQQFLQLTPTFRLATFQSRTPLRGEVRDLFINRLRKAGVPD